MTEKSLACRSRSAKSSRAPTIAAPASTTIGEALAQAKALLCAAGESGDSREARLEAEVLLAHVLGSTRASILAHCDQALSPSALCRYRSLLERRAAGEPLSYITGHREFYGLDFLVDSRVLIPRPETELLVEMAVAQGQRVPFPRIGDVGTGSGAIGISIAKYLPTAQVFGVDISQTALAVAAENARLHGVGARLTLLHGDLLDPLLLPVDVLVANLPYIADEALPGLQREVRREPALALLAGPDGLAVYNRLLEQANRHLRPGATLLLEVDPAQVDPLLAKARLHLPVASVVVAKDYAGRDRVVALTIAK